MDKAVPRPWAPRRCSHGPPGSTDARRAEGTCGGPGQRTSETVRKGSSHKKSERAPFSINIIKKYRDKIIEALKCYYRADIGKSNTIIRNLLKEIGENPFAVSSLNSSYAFPGEIGSELQLFRCRRGTPEKVFSSKDMLHLPCSLRAHSGNYRFSIPGNPSLYLSNSSYGCWIETGFPSDIDFNVSPVLLDGTQKVLNLVISVRDFTRLNEFESERVYTWLKLLMLVIATSYRIDEKDRLFGGDSG